MGRVGLGVTLPNLLTTIGPEGTGSNVRVFYCLFTHGMRPVIRAANPPTFKGVPVSPHINTIKQTMKTSHTLPVAPFDSNQGGQVSPWTYPCGWVCVCGGVWLCVDVV